MPKRYFSKTESQTSKAYQHQSHGMEQYREYLFHMKRILNFLLCAAIKFDSIEDEKCNFDSKFLVFD